MLQTLGRRSTFASFGIERTFRSSVSSASTAACIYPESINSAAQSGSQHVSHGGAHLRIAS
jgi:hypothetical protein